MKKILAYFILFTAIALPQSSDPEQILDELIKKFDKVHDYEVDVKVKVDVDFLKVPDSDAKLFYKQPDKIRIKSDRFAMLPKEGLNFSPTSILKGEHTSIYKGEETIDNNKVSVVKVIPLTDGSDIILTTLWIDQKLDIIRKIETTTKSAGSFSISLYYDNSNTSYALPSSMIFTFNIEGMNIPKGMAGQTPQNNSKPDTKKSGKVYLTYSNYKVNKGIPDSVFEAEKKKGE